MGILLSRRRLYVVAVVSFACASGLVASAWASSGEVNLRHSLNQRVQAFLETVREIEALQAGQPVILTGKDGSSLRPRQPGRLASLGGNPRLLGEASLLPKSRISGTLRPFSWQPALTQAGTRLFSFFTAVDLGTEDYAKPPYEPSDPDPPDGATDVPVSGVVLRWSGGDPNPGDEVVYDIYFNITPDFPGTYVDNHPDTSYELPDLAYATTYYWKIVAKDGTFETEGPVWTFTTESAPEPSATPTLPPASPTPEPEDTTPPSSTIEAPADNELITGKTYLVQGTASDDPGGSGVALVELSFDGGATWVAAEGTESWSYEWQITGDGEYTIWSRATDNAGNVETPGPGVTVTVDNTPPTILVAGWWDTYVTSSSGGTITMVALCQDEDVESVQIYYDGVPTGVFLVDDGTQGDQTPGDGLFTLSVAAGPGLAPAAYLLELVAVDQAGNESMVWPYLEIYAEDIYARPLARGVTWVEQMRNYVAGRPGDGASPMIYVGGYWDTRISTQSGGNLTILALVLDPQGPADISRVELYVMGTPTGVTLADDGAQGDWAANDGLYTLAAPVDPGLDPARYLVETVATDINGNRSMTYPYLEILP
jgi:hypothetical protein